jgi:streptogramin lyase
MFKRDGTFVKAWGEASIGTAHSLTIDRQNNYWVSDSTGHQVWKFDAEGKVLLTLGTKGKAGDNTSRDLFNQPNHVAIGANGDIYVSDGYVNARVVQFAPDGKFVRIIGGTKGKAPGELDTPHGVALDSKGRVLVNDSGNARVSVFDEDGKFVEAWPYPSRGGIEVMADDTVYVSDVNDGVINVSKGGKLIAKYLAPRAHGLGVDTDGSIFASGASRMTVMKIVQISTLSK